MKIPGRLTMTETRHLSSILARVHKKALVPTKKIVREAVKRELASVLGDPPYWKSRLTKLAYNALGLNTTKTKKVSPIKKVETRTVSPALLMGARNHERALVRDIPPDDR